MAKAGHPASLAGDAQRLRRSQLSRQCGFSIKLGFHALTARISSYLKYSTASFWPVSRRNRRTVSNAGLARRAAPASWRKPPQPAHAGGFS
jgi:hypothetical protein